MSANEGRVFVCHGVLSGANEGSDGFVASAAAPIASGWSVPVTGRVSHPLRTSAFHGAP